MARGVRIAAREAMQKFNYDPIEVLVMIAQDSNASLDTKKDVATTLLPYMYPKLSNVTLEGEVTTTTSAESSANLLQRILSDPELADAAQRLSVAAANAALEIDMGPSGSMLQ